MEVPTGRVGGGDHHEQQQQQQHQHQHQQHQQQHVSSSPNLQHPYSNPSFPQHYAQAHYHIPDFLRYQYTPTPTMVQGSLSDQEPGLKSMVKREMLSGSTPANHVQSMKLYRTVEKMWGGVAGGGGGPGPLGGGGSSDLPPQLSSAHNTNDADMREVMRLTEVKRSTPSPPPPAPTPMDTGNSHGPPAFPTHAIHNHHDSDQNEDQSEHPTHHPSSAPSADTPPPPPITQQHHEMKMDTSESDVPGLGIGVRADGGTSSIPNGPLSGPLGAAMTPSLLQQTMSQLLQRPSSPRGDTASAGPPSPLGHPADAPRPLYWGAAEDLRNDLDNRDGAHSPTGLDHSKREIC